MRHVQHRAAAQTQQHKLFGEKDQVTPTHTPKAGFLPKTPLLAQSEASPGHAHSRIKLQNLPLKK